MRMTPTSSPTNRPPCVGSVPAETGTVFLAASEPAIASAGTITKKRPTSIVSASVTLYHSVLAERPAKAEPLLAAADV